MPRFVRPLLRLPVAMVLHGPRHMIARLRCTWRRHRGMPIGVDRSVAGEALAFEKTGEALDLIARLDLRRWTRLNHDLGAIVVSRRTTAFSVLSATCYLDAKLVADQTAGSVALALVHEAVHARFAAAGILQSSHDGARQEVRCIREELAFLACLEAAGWTNAARMRAWLEECRADAQRAVAASNSVAPAV